MWPAWKPKVFEDLTEAWCGMHMVWERLVSCICPEVDRTVVAHWHNRLRKWHHARIQTWAPGIRIQTLFCCIFPWNWVQKVLRFLTSFLASNFLVLQEDQAKWINFLTPILEVKKPRSFGILLSRPCEKNTTSRCTRCLHMHNFFLLYWLFWHKQGPLLRWQDHASKQRNPLNQDSELKLNQRKQVTRLVHFSNFQARILKTVRFFFSQHAVVKARKAFSSDRWEKRKKRN